MKDGGPAFPCSKCGQQVIFRAMTKTQWQKVWKLFKARLRKREHHWYPSWRVQKRIIEQSVAEVTKGKS